MKGVRELVRRTNKSKSPEEMRLATTRLYNDYLDLVESAKDYADNYKYHPLRKKINRYCLENPDVVASLIFDARSNRIDPISYKENCWKLYMREELVFVLSKDDARTCYIESNQRWATFMRKYIVSQIEDEIILREVKWYQQSHGL